MDIANCSTYIFGDLGKGYTQYPIDYTKKLFVSFFVEGQNDSSLTFVREGRLVYYVYVRPLYGGGRYIGISCVFNDVLCVDFKSLFDLYENKIREIADEGVVLKFDGVTGKMIPTTMGFNHDVYVRIEESLRNCFIEGWVSFAKLPPINCSIDSKATKTFCFEDSTIAIFKAMKDYPTVLIRKELVNPVTHYADNASQRMTRDEFCEGLNIGLNDVLNVLKGLCCAFLWLFVFHNVGHFRTRAVDYVTEEILHINPNTKVIYYDRVKFKMKLVEGGTFMMGATDQDDEAKSWEKPAHKVRLVSYYIAETEVSQKLWEAVMKSNPSKYVGDDYPVDCVSWDDCMKFCDKLNQETGRHFRLPTEAEWEFAARGGNKSCYYKYSGSNVLEEVAWFLDNSDSTAHPIKKKKPNELGLYDMTGNAWELCNDWYSRYSGEEEVNPQGPDDSEKGKVRRGGGWLNSSKYCRITYRYYDQKGQCNDFRGFRLVMDLPVNQ